LTAPVRLVISSTLWPKQNQSALREAHDALATEPAAGAAAEAFDARLRVLEPGILPDPRGLPVAGPVEHALAGQRQARYRLILYEVVGKA
jgi:hypothetical protein